MLKTTVEIILRSFNRKGLSSRYLSTAVQPRHDEKLETFRTPENDPSKHNSQHLAQFYRIPLEDKNALFHQSALPKSFEEQTKTFNEICLMVRKPGIDIINYLNTLDYTKPSVRFVLYGQKGSGKTLSLAHILHYAYRNNYLLVHVPWVGNWMHRSKEFSNSETQEGYVDINLDAAAWLLHFKTQNVKLLKNTDLKLLETIEWNSRESTLKDAPLLELVEHGISRIKFASRVVNILADQIKRLSSEGVCKTLVAIDGYNAFFYPSTKVYTEKREMVPPSRITVTEAFLNLTKFDWTNSAIVVTVDELAVPDENQISYFPRYLLGKEGFNHIDPFIPVPVANYSKKELTSVINYYIERKWIQPYPGQEEELSLLANSNPYSLMKLCNSL
ncbi:28S ribosomal protein S29, mitochondrial [Sitophilus oryzae]|uniref:Small ribosomal subunit protein mS29 n=1 Tax=Sitophilus oryzae TaxID=7048 RepID=A0A6J2Y313_SITOR|nr:28S ribosomal protein S29, mitochondrial [Sitophilus oryzae]